MLDRASTFSHPEIVRLLQTAYVPVAIDQAYERRQKDNEGEFYRKIASQGPRKPGEGTTQGHYLASPDGTLLAYRNHRDPEIVANLLGEILAEFEAPSAKAIEAGQIDPKWGYTAPKGGLVVRVHSRVLGGYDEPKNERERLFQAGIGRDNLWIRADERASLMNGVFEESLLERIARFHLVDNTRGEPPMWDPEEVLMISLEQDRDHFSGQVHLKTDSGDREFKAALYGYLESDEDEITRFDFVVHGFFRGDGQFTRGAPEGDFPLGIQFELADGSDIADNIPPQGSRGWLEGYLD
ncbi:MAG: hypothetical protein AAGC68_01965 [Verrucomicrobiota bacterium]